MQLSSGITVANGRIIRMTGSGRAVKRTKEDYESGTRGNNSTKEEEEEVQRRHYIFILTIATASRETCLPSTRSTGPPRTGLSSILTPHTTTT